MKHESSHRFFLVFRDTSGATVHEEEVTDFLALSHDLAFSAVRSGALPNDGNWGGARIEPVWEDGKLSRIAASLAGRQKTYDVSVIGDQARSLFLARGLLKPEEGEEEKEGLLTWKLEPRERDGQARERKLRMSVTQRPYPLVRRALSEFGIQRPPATEEPTSLLVSAALLAELRESAANCLERERADVLTGYLVQEPENISIVVLGRIPAEVDTTSSVAHISFSPKTFEAVRKEHERRGTDQVILGWAHNHPPPCKQECLMTVPACKTENVFFSVADRCVHRASFGAPYMVGLVFGKGAIRRADDPLVRAYGWRDGEVRERSYAVFVGGVK